MSNLPHAKHFTELSVWQASRRLAKEVFALSSGFPKEENFALTSQIRRASRSVGAQIAEAWAKRRYEKHFVSKLTDADGENYETQHWIIVAYDSAYFTHEQANHLGDQSKQIGSMVGRMISLSADFCGELENHPSRVQEPSDLAEFFLPPDPEFRFPARI